MPKGDYTATIVYQCETDQSFLPYADKPNDKYIKADIATLDKCSNVMSYDFRTTEDIEDFELVVYYNGEGNFSISQITLERNDNQLRRMFVYLIFLVFAINAIVLCQMSMKEWKKYIFGIAVIAILTSLPLWFQGLHDVDGQDLVFHLMRIEGISKELQLGNFPVRISSAWLGEYGYPTSIYYGDILLYIPAILRIFGFDVNTAYKIFVFLINLGTAVISEYCFRKITKKENLSIILALVYLTSSYRLVDIYVRAAVGEYIALMFLPLIMLAIYNIYTDRNQTLKDNMVNAAILAIGMTGVITAHVLSAEMLVFVIALICIICIRKTCTWNSIRTYLMAIGETLLLSAFFIVPFIDCYMNESVKITYIVNEAATRTIQSKGCRISDYIDFFRNPFIKGSELLLTPGIVLVAALIVAVILWISKRSTNEMKITTILAVILIVMSTNLFPWDALANKSLFFNLLAQVQFPWRYIGIVSAILTLLLGLIFLQVDLGSAAKNSSKLFGSICIMISICTTVAFTGQYASEAKDTIYYDTENLDTYYIMNAEYLRLGTDKHNLDGKIIAEEVEYINVLARSGCNMDIMCKTREEEGYIVLPVINYRGYVIKDEYGNSYKVEDGNNSCVSFRLPENYEGKIYLRYEEPWYWTAALIVSLTSIAAIAGIGIIGVTKFKKEKTI